MFVFSYVSRTSSITIYLLFILSEFYIYYISVYLYLIFRYFQEILSNIVILLYNFLYLQIFVSFILHIHGNTLHVPKHKLTSIANPITRRRYDFFCSCSDKTCLILALIGLLAKDATGNC